MAVINQKTWKYVSSVIFLWALAQGLFSSHYLFFSPENYSFVQQHLTYAASAGSILSHIGLGIIALVTGSLQFSRRLRQRRPKLHRRLGYVYFATVLCSGVSALIFAPEAHGGASNTAAFSLLAVLWLGSTITAVNFARRGRLVEHRQWMMRSYALTFAAATLRLQLGLFIALGLTFDQAYLIVPWTAWIVNLILVEWWLLPKVSADSKALS